MAHHQAAAAQLDDGNEPLGFPLIAPAKTGTVCSIRPADPGAAPAEPPIQFLAQFAARQQ
jgi:hypothetical protein